jgi:hypothetical protein
MLQAPDKYTSTYNTVDSGMMPHCELQQSYEMCAKKSNYIRQLQVEHRSKGEVDTKLTKCGGKN